MQHWAPLLASRQARPRRHPSTANCELFPCVVASQSVAVSLACPPPPHKSFMIKFLLSSVRPSALRSLRRPRAGLGSIVVVRRRRRRRCVCHLNCAYKWIANGTQRERESAADGHSRRMTNPRVTSTDRRQSNDAPRQTGHPRGPCPSHTRTFCCCCFCCMQRQGEQHLRHSDGSE